MYAERIRVMKAIAILYSTVLGGVALWTWIVYFQYDGTIGEHLLPGVVLQLVTLPSSLLMERIVDLVPWVFNKPVVILSLTTGLGGLQAAVVWLIAMRFKFFGI